MLPIDFPDDWQVSVIQKKPMPALTNPQRSLSSALRQPDGCRSLIEEARGRRQACILICDMTRPVPNSTILPLVIRTLIDAGLNAHDITVLVATGLHRPNEDDELRMLVGSDPIVNSVQIENHDARIDADHVALGKTIRGTPVRLDRRFVQADLRLVVGLVEPHFMAGYSGGRKVITPGVAHQETITTLHTAKFLENPNSDNCVIEGNPLHEEQLEIVEMIGGALAVNVVIDEKRRISFVNFGEITRSHLSAVAFMREYAEIPVPILFKTVVTSSAGYPLDATYYQTVKGMVAASNILQRGGNLLIVSQCSEGMGSPAYVDAQRRLAALGLDGFLQTLRNKSQANIDEWQTEMQLKAMRRGGVYLYSEGLSEPERALTGVRTVNCAQKSVLNLVESAGDKRVAVIPEGPYVVPIGRSRDG